jgi:hypothetical protein
MRRPLLTAVLLVTLSSGIAAKEGQIALFSDPGGGNCNITDAPTEIQVHVVHVNYSGEVGQISFAVESGPGFTGTWLSDTQIFPAGTFNFSFNGVFIAYGGCLPAPVHALTINYMTFGTSAECSTIDVVANFNDTPPSPSSLICPSGQKIAVQGKPITVNPDGTCDCTVPVRASTWGKIKAIYHGP